MSRFVNVPNSFNGVAVGASATLELPAAGRYEAIKLYPTTAGVAMTQAQMAAMIDLVTINVNGTPQREFTPAELKAINAFKGLPVQDGVMTLFFAEPERITAAGEDATAWGMADVDSFDIVVKFAAGAITPGITAKRKWLPINTPMGDIVKWRRNFVDAAGAGTKQTALDRTGDDIQSIHAFSAAVTAVKLEIEAQELLSGTIFELEDYYLDHGFIGQANVAHVSAEAQGGRFGDVFPTAIKDANLNPVRLVSSAVLEYTMSGASNFPTITEYRGLRD